MINDHLKIIFLGTPEFAVASLRILVENGFHVVAVITAPDKPAGRGLQMQESPVKRYATEKNIKVLQPLKLKDPVFISELKSYNADLQVVVAFRMLPEIVWNMPRLGTINLHASLLPDYRGAAPINWALINGESETGVTTFFLKHEIDTGDMIMRENIKIDLQETAGSLHDKLMIFGAEVLYKSVRKIEEENYELLPQTKTSYKIAPKINKQDCAINWNQSAEKIEAFVRGLSPYPTAYTFLDGKLLKVYEVSADVSDGESIPGTHESDNKTYLKFAAQSGWVNVLELQLEGKKKMRIVEFLRGYQVKTT